MSKITQTYGADDIKTLSPRDHIRKRPAMVLGGADNDAIFHAWKEVFDNGMDEFQNGHADRIDILLSDDCTTVTTRDNGRGIPVGKNKKGENSLTVAVSSLMSGGKFEDDAEKKGAYRSGSVGTHGYGVKCTNYTSKTFEVLVWREGKCWTQRFKEGLPTSKVEELPKRAREYKHGTEITFSPDATVFTEMKKDAPPFDVAKFRQFVSSAVHLCVGLTVTLTHQGTTETFLSKTGIAGYVKERAAQNNRPLLQAEPITFESKHVSFSFAWADTEESETTWLGFVNRSPTPDGGTHVQGFKRALVKALSDTSKRTKAKADDICDGLLALVSVLVAAPKFKGQTKNALGNKETEKEVFDVTYEFLHKFFAKGDGKTIAREMLERAAHLGEARSKHRELRKAVQETSSGGGWPKKLKRSKTSNPKERELFLVEGDSAGGSVLKARDNQWQEMLPLRGKFRNAAKSSIAKLLKSEEVKNILQSIGIRINPKNPSVRDLSKLRVGRIVLLMDADPDGRHIECITLTLLSILAPEVIERGMVYIVLSPLFMAVAKDGKGRWFGNTKDELLKKSGKSLEGLNITRLKGHGEANWQDVRTYATDPRTRNMSKVSFSEKEKGIVELVMGEDVAARRELLGIETPEDSSASEKRSGKPAHKKAAPRAKRKAPAKKTPKKR